MPDRVTVRPSITWPASATVKLVVPVRRPSRVLAHSVCDCVGRTGRPRNSNAPPGPVSVARFVHRDERTKDPGPVGVAHQAAHGPVALLAQDLDHDVPAPQVSPAAAVAEMDSRSRWLSAALDREGARRMPVNT